MRIDHHVHLDPEIAGSLRDINRKLDYLIRNQEIIMATLDQILADVTAESTDIGSLSKLLGGLRQQLADALAGTIPPEAQAKIDAIFTQVESNRGKVTEALAANTEVAPPAPVPETPPPTA